MQINENNKITCDDVKTMWIDWLQAIGYIQAKEDVIPFIKDICVLNIWSKVFFISITNNLISNES